ncbi:MAG: hypothetical protein ACO25B_08285 [Chitinophagaceae bacterium]
MMTYILLRNNKESGPFLLEELVDTGLRPDDLVWVEGQSVCWLRAPEIPELRFHVGKPPVLKPVSAPETDVRAKDQPENVKPVNGSGALPKKMIKTTSQTQDISFDSIGKGTQVNRSSLPGPIIYFPVHVIPALQKYAVYAVILVFGLMAGFLLRQKSSKSRAPVLITSAEQYPEPPVESPAGQEEDPDSILLSPVTESPEAINAVEKPDNTKETASTIPGKKTRNKENPPPTQKLPAKTMDKLPGAGLREKETTGAVNKTAPALPDLNAQVKITSNDYSVGSFGGIKNLELTVSNASAFTLSKVIVDLDYLKPRDEWIRTEKIIFHSVAPGGSQTIAVPKSSRGVNIRFRIAHIEPEAEPVARSGQ